MFAFVVVVVVCWCVSEAWEGAAGRRHVGHVQGGNRSDPTCVSSFDTCLVAEPLHRLAAQPRGEAEGGHRLTALEGVAVFG